MKSPNTRIRRIFPPFKGLLIKARTTMLPKTEPAGGKNGKAQCKRTLAGWIEGGKRVVQNPARKHRGGLHFRVAFRGGERPESGRPDRSRTRELLLHGVLRGSREGRLQA